MSTQYQIHTALHLTYYEISSPGMSTAGDASAHPVVGAISGRLATPPPPVRELSPFESTFSHMFRQYILSVGNIHHIELESGMGK